jgi:hypothetical protein
MYNADQRDHMDYLSNKPPETRCWCGWYTLGECPRCPPGATAADKIKTACPYCGNAASGPGGEVVHTIKCLIG